MTVAGVAATTTQHRRRYIYASVSLTSYTIQHVECLATGRLIHRNHSKRLSLKLEQRPTPTQRPSAGLLESTCNRNHALPMLWTTRIRRCPAHASCLLDAQGRRPDGAARKGIPDTDDAKDRQNAADSSACYLSRLFDVATFVGRSHVVSESGLTPKTQLHWRPPQFNPTALVKRYISFGLQCFSAKVRGLQRWTGRGSTPHAPHHTAQIFTSGGQNMSNHCRWRSR